MSVQGTLSAVDRSVRSVFVGNIPYEATEEQLKDIFSEVGPVVSFRLVYDRESGKPKGYGFCEYKDQETALSAMRNLNGYELNGRALRVDNAASEKNKEELKNLQASLGGPPQESPYGTDVEPDKAPEAISKAVASLPPEQMFELMKQMKLCIQTNPNEARNMLLQNPQLAYALLQAQVVMRIVEPQVAMAMLHRANHNVQPLLLPQNVPESNLIAAPTIMPAPSLAGPININNQGVMPTITNNNFIDPPYSGGGIAQSAAVRVRPALLGERPAAAAEIPPSRPLPNQFSDPRGPVRDFDLRDPRGGGGVVVDRDRDIRGPHAGGGPNLPPIRDSRDVRDPRDLRDAVVPPARDPRMGSGEPEMRPNFDPRFSRGDPRASRGGDFDQRAFDQRGPNVFPERGFEQQSPVYEQRGDPRAPNVNPIAANRPPPAAVLPRPMQVAAPPAVRLPGASQSPISAQDHEKAALIMQVLQLSEQQISMLPAEQRQSIMVLKEQIARSTGVPQ